MSDMNDRGLPAYCYAIAPKTRLPVRIFRGEHAMFGVRPDMMVSKANAQISVDARQAAAMAGGRALRLGRSARRPRPV